MRQYVVTSISLRAAKPTTLRTDVLVIAAAKAGEAVQPLGPGEGVASAFGSSFAKTLSTLGFSGKEGEVAKLTSNGAVRASVVMVVGVGDAETVDAERLRRAAAVCMRAMGKVASAAVAFPTSTEQAVQAISEGVQLGSYTFDRYRTAPSSNGVAETVVVSDLARTGPGKQAADTAAVVAGAVARTRDWVNTPPGDLSPVDFAAAVTALDAPARVKVTVWDEKRLATERCGGILGVGRGSANPPRLVRVDYRPRKPVTHLALVGKGITFDSGGITLKNAAGLMTMKCDMAGAATVVAATYAIAELGLPVEVTCLAAMAENMPSGTATRPGDVLTIRNGRTVEVLNTDAEGRLVLADALVLAGEAEPDHIVDVATLTGACIVALGQRTAGVLSNDDGLRDQVVAAAGRAGESMWPLPIPEEMKTKVTSSSVADLRQHNPDTSGGTLFASAFLREFVADQRWAHLDIAGPAFHDGEPYGYVSKGGTGAAVRTLVRLAQDLSEPGR